MHRAVRTSPRVGLAALFASALLPVAVLAAAPSNDTFAGATAATVGFSETLDTTEATTDADDAQLNSSCGAPATDASVWYSIAGTDQNVLVDVSQSDYSAGVLVGVGSEGALTTVACGPQAVAFFAEAGTTYYILAIDDQQNGDGLNGGSLSISFSSVATPTLDAFTVNRTGTVNTKTGVATISGTFACSGGDFLEVDVEASQPVGRFTIRGFGSFVADGVCDGTSRPWRADVVPDNGKFAGGKAMTANFATACGPLECADGYLEVSVMLRGTKK